MEKKKRVLGKWKQKWQTLWYFYIIHQSQAIKWQPFFNIIENRCSEMWNLTPSIINLLKRVWSPMDWSCRVHSDIIGPSQECSSEAKSASDAWENEWTGSRKGRKPPGMGYLSLKEKGFSGDGRKEIAPSSGVWPTDLGFMVSCLLSGVRDWATETNCPGMWQDRGSWWQVPPQCAWCQLAWNYLRHCLLRELVVPWFIKST
jgi:hypothetical protein